MTHTIEIKTLAQNIHDPLYRDEADAELASALNDGWTIQHQQIVAYPEHPATRYVTLQRTVTLDPAPPPTAKVEIETPVTVPEPMPAPVHAPVAKSITPLPDIIVEPVWNYSSQPYPLAENIRRHGLDAVLEMMDARVRDRIIETVEGGIKPITISSRPPRRAEEVADV